MYDILMKLCVRVFYFLPVKKNKIVFLNDYGLGYGCNLKYVAEKILQRKLPYKLVWIVNNLNYNLPKCIIKAKISRISSVYHLATAKIVINNIKGYMNVRKKKNQYFIYIPHGQTGAKKAEKEMYCLTPEYKAASVWHSKNMDLFVTCSEAQSKDMVENFFCSCEILQCGFPRNDVFFAIDQEQKRQIKKSLGILGKKCLLYAPTFRDDNNDKAYSIDLNKLLITLSEKFGGDWVILVRLHPNFIWFSIPQFNYSEKIINVTKYEDIQELFIISDVLITDYSSTMFDFNNSRRPIFLFVPDLNEYSKTRGLKDFYFTVPFPMCKNNEELNKAIREFEMQSYQKQIDIFNISYGDVDDGHASDYVVDRIQNVINEKL